MSLRILVVEDEETNMKIIAISLRHRGHEVLEATNPIDGLAMAREHKPDVVLMDLMFKNAAFDGIEAIRRLKADARTASIPVVAHTASVLDYKELVVRDAGADGFIRKPFRRQELLDVITETLAGTLTARVPAMAPARWSTPYRPGARVTAPRSPHGLT
jgi:two-component system cell cycle response regulator DivK